MNLFDWLQKPRQAIDTLTIARKRTAQAMPRKRAIDAAQLEDRMMLSASPAAGALAGNINNIDLADEMAFQPANVVDAPVTSDVASLAIQNYNNSSNRGTESTDNELL